ncbi:2277_t:CDS:1, partial [Scutellospora calospora]
SIEFRKKQKDLRLLREKQRTAKENNYQENFSSENPYINDMQISSEPTETSPAEISETSSQDIDSSNEDNLAKTTTEIASENVTKEADKPHLTKTIENSDSEKDNNMEEITFNIVISKKCKKKNSPKDSSSSSE